MNTVAVLGGGISGLSTAYYLSRLTPLKVLLIEGKERVGGWIQSQRVKDDILFEAGPRSLRPEGANGAILLEMVGWIFGFFFYDNKKKKTKLFMDLVIIISYNTLNYKMIF
jgi:glycine/D-amino acid oxidase-like deaminating enzyme